MDVGGKEGVSAETRLHEIREEEARDIEKAEQARKNRDFAQVYSEGWAKIRSLADKSPAAVKLYALIAEHIDGRTGAVIASQVLLAELLGVSERTIRRLSIDLEEAKALGRLKIGTGVYAYALNPAEVWKSWENRKGHAAFLTKTLVNSKAAREGTIRMQAMIQSKEVSKKEDTNHQSDLIEFLT